MSSAINQWVEWLSSSIIAKAWLAPLFALVGGMLTAFTPCALTSVPLVIGYVGGTGQRETRRAFWLSVVFSLGSAITFTVLGTVASLLGTLMRVAGSWWYLALGVLMVLMALQTWEIFSFIPSSHAMNRSTRRGFLGAFLAGVLGGLFSSPCATPILVALLGIVAREGSLAWGALLLLLYSFGHSVLVLLAGTSVGFMQKLRTSERYARSSSILRIVMGAAMMLIGFYMFYLGF
jgi:cytochrome c-type biogenesis protein